MVVMMVVVVMVVVSSISNTVHHDVFRGILSIPGWCPSEMDEEKIGTKRKGKERSGVERSGGVERER
ncbi:hypothetical protein M0804_015389 [Polistes exclamans]|nr:hypothetical protein M0804_015390 [Polistes exclamans]KAI4473334.1 hypothetical protein M0804_015389 [Polistes exclamans]